MVVERLLFQDDNNNYYTKKKLYFILMSITYFVLRRASPSNQSIFWQVVRNGENCGQQQRNVASYHPHRLLSLIEQNTSNVLNFFPINNLKQNI